MSPCRVLVVLTVGLLGTAAPAAASPDPGSAVLPVAAAVDPTDLRWLAPAFSAEPDRRAEWQRYVELATAVQRRRTRDVRERLARLGHEADALPEGCYGDEYCSLVLDGTRLATRFASWDHLAAAGRAAAPYVESFRRAAAIVTSELSTDPSAGSGEEIVREARRRMVHDQLLRLALLGVPGKPDLPADEATADVFAFALAADLRRVDAANVAFAAEFVAAKGWPMTPEFPAETHRAFSLLAQHGDDFPVAQVSLLFAMEQAHAKRGRLPTEYAYLYDRVMLKLVGAQRYGTQVTCIEGKRVPKPLDGAGSVDELRARIGLGPMAEYLVKFPPCSDRVG